MTSRHPEQSEGSILDSSGKSPLNDGKRAAFTLAETMIVLVILGIVAAITVPALVRNQMDAQNRTRLRKAMTVYDMAVNKMVVENNFKNTTALTNWGNGNNCVNTRAYFKSAQDGANNCIFRASDGVWWDMTDITRPIIGLSQDDLNNPNSNTRFQLFAHIDRNGTLRIDDIQYDKANLDNDNYIQQTDIDNLTTLYNYVNNLKETKSEFQKNCVPINDSQCKIGDTIYTKKSIEKTTADKFDNGNDLCIWTEEEGQTCPYISVAEKGDLYYTDPVSYNEVKGYIDSDSSTCQFCKKYGVNDYYNAAKRYCDAQGGRLPTIAELKSIGIDRGYYWASEEYNPDYVIRIYNGNIQRGDKNSDSAIICVGK